MIHSFLFWYVIGCIIFGLSWVIILKVCEKQNINKVQAYRIFKRSFWSWLGIVFLIVSGMILLVISISDLLNRLDKYIEDKLK